jgi:uncharacterized alkaline shock family protein YloU
VAEEAQGRRTVDEMAIARAVLVAVHAVSGVVGVSPGLFAETATYGSGERILGVAVGRVAGALNLELHLVAEYTASTHLPDLADRVRSAARQAVEVLGAGPVRRIDVAIDDLRVEANNSSP